MTITELKALLAAISKESFSLTATQLGVDSVAELFQTYLPQSTLTLVHPQADVDKLQVSGKVDLGSATNAQTLVTFLPDHTNPVVAGINIKLDLSSWTFTSPFADFSLTAVQQFGFSTPGLVLSAGDSDLAVGSAAAFVSGARTVVGQSGRKIVTLLAQIPPDDPDLRANTYTFDVELDDITLADLSKLQQFVGTEFTLPDTIPIADSLALKRIEFGIDPDRDQMMAVRLTVGSARGITVVANVFVITSFTFSFQVGMAGAGPKEVHGVVATRLNVYQQEFDLALSLPELVLSGVLNHDTPVKLKPFVSEFVDAKLIPDEFELSSLYLAVGLKEPHNYRFDITLENLWMVSIGKQELRMTRLSVSLEGEGSNPPGFSIEGTIKLAGTDFFLSAKTEQGSNSWQFKGGTVDAGPNQIKGFESDGVQIGALINDLGTLFGVKDVPAPVKSLVLRDIQLSFDTGKSAFTFHCTGEFKVESTLVVLMVVIEIEKDLQTNNFNAKFKGELQIGNLQFDLIFDHENIESDTFIATYSHKDGDPDSISLHDLIAPLSPELAKNVPEGIEIQLKDVKFVFYSKKDEHDQATKQFAFGLDLALSIDLSHLPVVGSKLPEDLSLDVDDLQCVYSSKLFSKTLIEEINSLLPKTVTHFPEEGMSAGINLAADLKLGSKSIHLALGVPPKEEKTVRQLTGGVTEDGTAMALDAPSSSMKWIDVQKQFGIFQFDRIGAGYDKNVLSFALDAGVALGPLSFEMSGLSVGSPLTEFVPVFDLSGLALEYKKPPLELGGAFLKTIEEDNGNKITSYYGEVMVKAGKFNLKAIGGWAPDAKPASFFIYLNISAPIGGPPFFFITGLAGGLGINRALVLPTLDKLPDCRLLPGKAPKPAGSPSATIKEVLPELRELFVNAPGQFWVAAGVQFTSFEMIEAFVLLTVAFGVDLQIALLGTCAMTFPTDEPQPVAYIEVNLIATLRPSTGQLAVDGKLSPASYVYGGFVKLSGGFAFYAWFSGDNHGDFVVSVGGYHPAFDKPEHYPTVARLAMEFALGPLQVAGEAYFALTPSMMMAGIRMSAVWTSGRIKAWLEAGLDFLIGWAPFHYEAGAFINIGCSVDLGLYTLDVSVGAGIYVWGPPFGGRVHVDLDVVSFTIAFGAEPATPPPIGWNTFKDKFLPQDSTVPHSPQPRRVARQARSRAGAGAETRSNTIKASVSTGLLQSDVSGFDWVLDSDHFAIATSSTIPANNGEWALSATNAANLPNAVSSYVPPRINATTGLYLELTPKTTTFSDTQVWNPTVNIAPMGVNNVKSYHTVQVCKRTDSDDKNTFSKFITDLAVAPVLLPSTTALWGEDKTDKKPNDPLLMPAALTGFLLTPIPRTPASVNDVPLIALIYARGFSTGFRYQKAVVDPDYTVNSSIIDEPNKHELDINVSGKRTATLANKDYILSSLTDTWVTDQRKSILDDLAANGFSTYKSNQIDLDTMAKQTALTDWPAIKMLGS